MSALGSRMDRLEQLLKARHGLLMLPWALEANGRASVRLAGVPYIQQADETREEFFSRIVASASGRAVVISKEDEAL